MKPNKNILTLIIAFILMSCNQTQIPNHLVVGGQKVQKIQWKSDLDAKLKLFGHRNWIVIADGAYPQQSNPAIETISIETSQLEAIEFVSELIERSTHVNANIFVDKELDYVSEKNAKGIVNYRDGLNKILEGKIVKAVLHEEIIKELDTSAKLFNVLILKTNLTIPYTSVFFQLECGYWNARSEEDLRKNLGQAN